MPKSLREAAAEAIREYDAWVQDVESVIGRQPKTTFMDNLRAALDAPDGWISVEERLPEPGMQVAALRSNGTWDRASCNPIYFEGLAAWYLPEGPTPCGSWQDAGLYVTHWMPLPEPPKSREGAE